MFELEDLKVLKCSPDLLDNCKTGQGQLQLIMKHILFHHIWGSQPIWSSNLNNLTAGLENCTRPLVFTSESSVRVSGNCHLLARQDE